MSEYLLRERLRDWALAALTRAGKCPVGSNCRFSRPLQKMVMLSQLSSLPALEAAQMSIGVRAARCGRTCALSEHMRRGLGDGVCLTLPEAQSRLQAENDRRIRKTA